MHSDLDRTPLTVRSFGSGRERLFRGSPASLGFGEIEPMQMDASAPRQDSDAVLDALANVLHPLTVQAREVLLQQARAVANLSLRLDQSFASAIRLLYRVEGHVVICGLGKSGHVGRKIAATLACTGTPSRRWRKIKTKLKLIFRQILPICSFSMCILAPNWMHITPKFAILNCSPTISKKCSR